MAALQQMAAWAGLAPRPTAAKENAIARRLGGRRRTATVQPAESPLAYPREASIRLPHRAGHLQLERGLRQEQDLRLDRRALDLSHGAPCFSRGVHVVDHEKSVKQVPAERAAIER